MLSLHKSRHKIVLYNPQAVFYTMPLALLAIGSYLDPQAYEVRIIDGRLEKDAVSAVLAEIEDALCLGVTVLTGAPIQDALRITQAARARRPDLPVIWGGWHPSLFPLETLAEANVDVAVIGQGEQTFAEIVARLAQGERDLGGIPGCAWRAFYPPATEDSVPEIIMNAPRALRDINQFPAMNYDLIPVERYFTLKRRALQGRQSRQLDYISSQGCRFRCTFCADPFVYKRGWFGLEPARMGEELEQLWWRYHFMDVGFQDETFFTSPRRLANIAEEFLRRDLGFTWMATMRADQGYRLDEAVLAACKRAGLRRVMIGMESGSQEMLDHIKKDIKIEQVFDCAEKCQRQGVAILFNIIVGFPDETAESVTESLRIAKELRAMSPDFEIAVFYYKPYPGNEIADTLQRQGYRFPRTLAEWAEFDYVGSSGPWVTKVKHDLVEGFKFYQRIAWSQPTLLRTPIQALARWRCRHDNYGWPVERVILERLRPGPKLS
ncbi:MAG: B12-binding domain-containing radical SAM protein [Chloroflexi bacterium]|nr:B12-binding domain-containing radical SAM protein [Chloroflexota bacterium]